MTKSKTILALLGLYCLFTASWGASVAFADTAVQTSTVAMMGMLGALSQGVVIFASLTFPAGVRRTLTLLLLVWHIPEALLIATMGMGVPLQTQASGVTIHAVFCVLAMLAWFLDRDQASTLPEPALA